MAEVGYPGCDAACGNARERDIKDATRYRWLRDVADARGRPIGLRDGGSAEQADADVDAEMDGVALE